MDLYLIKPEIGRTGITYSRGLAASTGVGSSILYCDHRSGYYLFSKDAIKLKKRE